VGEHHTLPAVGGSHHLEVVEVDTAEVLGNLLLAAEVDTQTHLPAEQDSLGFHLDLGTAC